MAAALVTALARAALHATASVPARMASPAGTLREAGARPHRDVGSGHFVACALAVVEPPNLLHRGPRLVLSNAAQVPVLLMRDAAASELEAAGDRLPLGARPDGDYEDVKAELRPGDAVVFSSDGLVEAPALAQATPGEHLAPPQTAGELFGADGAAERVAATAAEAGRALGTAGGAIRPCLVLHQRDGARAPAGWHGPVLLDPTGQAHRIYGAAGPRLYLVRPDGYIGFAGGPHSAPALLAYSAGMFGAGTRPGSRREVPAAVR